MKKNNCTLFLLLIVMTFSCKNADKKKGQLLSVDVSKSYPKKEIALQDIAEVIYIPLETKKNVLIEDFSHFYNLSSDTIIIGNGMEGSIFLFDGKGKFLSKFNNKGPSDREYQEVWGIKADRKAQEIFVIDYPLHYRIQVYDMEGNYKRTLTLSHKYSFTNAEIINYNDQALLCYDRFDAFGAKMVDSIKINLEPFILISKQDGSILKRLPISLKNRIDTDVMEEGENGMTDIVLASLNSVVPAEGGNFILSESSLDTIFTYSKEGKLTPLIARTPEIQKMQEPRAFLQVQKVMPSYIWAEIITKQPKEKRHFRTTQLLLDRVANEIFQCNLYNRESPDLELSTVLIPNSQALLIGADELKDALEEDKLAGELKTVAEKLKVDDNPVVLQLKFRKQ